MSAMLKTFNHYSILVLGLLILSFCFFYLPAYRVMISVLIGLIYFAWGVLTHWVDDSLYWPVMLEYLSFSLLAVIILIFLSV